ncbi:hypothetical protein J1N35_000626 [Gossypium stocksii]|uniref:Reverse transcriptase zinc-binding domain-containing protein n=1 Tax=Gossypium stocksii TaxID=47602 RepID=A0A9D3WIQ9_9ROSI|nr:hypothetical protein J1N35_000626 [Gossypium stocksii]
MQRNREEACQILGINLSVNKEKYLGLPLIVGCNKKGEFREIKENLMKKVSNWSSRMLSVGRRKVLIKAVLQATPMYTMYCFLLPNSFSKELEAVIAKFWGQKKVGRKGLHWCSWNLLCISKNEGGMGFRDLAKFNIDLLEKQGWRLIETPDSLIARLIRVKYYHGSNFMEAPLGLNPSLIWRYIWGSKALLKFGLR